MSKRQAERRKYHFIYKTTCSVNGKFYYGMHSTDNLDDGYLGSGTRLWHSIKKHGRENFSMEILEHLESREALKLREAELINEEMLLDPLCMNLTLGGGEGWEIVNRNLTVEQRTRAGKAGGFANRSKMSEEVLLKIKLVGINNGRKFLTNNENTPHWRALGRDAAKSLEAIEKRKLAFQQIRHQRGELNSQFGKCWIYHELIGARKCKKELLPEYIEQGWFKGRNGSLM